VSVPGPPGHLVRRFFGSLRARRPRPADQAWVASVLSSEEAALFWAQPPVDQHHGVSVARRVAAGGAPPPVVAAALLHDVGKRHSSTGTVARSLASAAAMLRIPVRGRWRDYLEHGELGARDLEAIGAGPVAVAFARHHHHDRPAGVSDAAWTALSSADGG
jgi:HD domain